MLDIKQSLSGEEIDRIIEMAWEDRTTFDAINRQFGITEQQVISIMRNQLKTSSFRMWRARVSGRKTKHDFSASTDFRFKCSRQSHISMNKFK